MKALKAVTELLVITDSAGYPHPDTDPGISDKTPKSYI
jgi:hypothetical protein